MSFKYGEYGTGFSLVRPPKVALRFHRMVESRGRSVTIVKKTPTGVVDDYGDPTYTETTYSINAMIQEKGRELVTQAGYARQAALTLFVAIWAAVQEDNNEIEWQGNRYEITSCVEGEAYKKVEAERNLE